MGLALSKQKKLLKRLLEATILSTDLNAASQHTKIGEISVFKKQFRVKDAYDLTFKTKENGFCKTLLAQIPSAFVVQYGLNLMQYITFQNVEPIPLGLLF